MKTAVLMILSFFILACQGEQIQPGFTKGPGKPAGEFTRFAGVETRNLVKHHEAVGTIRPHTDSVIESRVPGQVLKVNAAPGDRVDEGAVLAVLDGRQLSARLRQAGEGRSVADQTLKQALKAVDEARAALDQADAAHRRSQTLFEKDIIPSQKLEIDRAAYLTAKARLEKTQEAVAAARAGVRQAAEVVQEARIAMEYTRITAPAAGVVVRRLVDPGDQAVPGKPLLVLQTSGALRLEAHVREGLIHHIVRGKTYEVEIRAPGKTVPAEIQEIVPYADPETRTFLVKAALPDTPGIYPGMFGRLLIPVEEVTALLIPGEAVVRVGQLEMVNVRNENDRFRSVYIKTGPALGPDIQVLSGLTGDETLGW